MVRLRYNGERKLFGRLGWLNEHDVVDLTQAEFEHIKKSGEWQKRWTYAKKGDRHIVYGPEDLRDLQKEVLMEVVVKLKSDGRPIHVRPGASRAAIISAIHSATGYGRNPIYKPEDPSEIGKIVMNDGSGKNTKSDLVGKKDAE